MARCARLARAGNRFARWAALFGPPGARLDSVRDGARRVRRICPQRVVRSLQPPRVPDEPGHAVLLRRAGLLDRGGTRRQPDLSRFLPPARARMVGGDRYPAADRRQYRVQRRAPLRAWADRTRNGRAAQRAAPAFGAQRDDQRAAATEARAGFGRGARRAAAARAAGRCTGQSGRSQSNGGRVRRSPCDRRS